ncbi:unnamed protein product [Polarella glacialis]|uniref:Uncharacterized protein n=1 Tax=Polarella glacialis TaxID=89957 RepID=A0A813KC06_POLGL|nr:unnamed protein product [Polarella glacialis]
MKIQICPGAAGMLPLFDADNRLTQNNKQHRLASAYLWYDYFGIPQIVERTEDQNVGAELQKAVDSIPAFIARCQHFFILAPPMMHVHRGYLVNTQAWSERGWCRTELACWALHGDRPCYNMVSPTLIFETTPSGWILCPPRFGNFAVEADRATVNKLIGIMIEHRVEFLRENMDEQFEFRLLNALQCHMATLRKAKTDLDAWLKDFCFQSPTEAAPPYGWTPIHLAAVQGNVAIIDALVERSADVNAKTTKKYKTLRFSSKGKTPLMLAALYIADEEVSLATLDALVRHRADLSLQDSLLQLVVHNAARGAMQGPALAEGGLNGGEPGSHLLNLLTRRLVRKGANPDDENKFGFSMTKNIAGVGNPELLKLCLERGGRHDASFKAKFPFSLLFSGIRLKKRMDKRMDKQFHYLTHLVARIEGSTPLHQAAEMGNVEGIRQGCCCYCCGYCCCCWLLLLLFIVVVAARLPKTNTSLQETNSFANYNSKPTSKIAKKNTLLQEQKQHCKEQQSNAKKTPPYKKQINIATNNKATTKQPLQTTNNPMTTKQP